MKNIIVFTIFVLSSFSQQPIKIFEKPLSPRNANYDINVTLEPKSKKLYGQQTLTWKNITKNPTNELLFHLYLNAFSHNKTTFMIESGGQHRSGSFNSKFNGFNKISSFKIENKELLDQLKFIQPDDGNINDSTVIKLDLEQPIQPNDSVIIEINFTAKLPQVFARTGHADESITKDYFLVAQWFPKIGVLEETGWNCHQFHGNTEFFSDYGVYNVSITTPKNFIVGATGLLYAQSNTDSTITYSYHAEDVHDFAWTAYPGFNVHQEKYKGISIRFLYNDEDFEDIYDQVQSLKYGIDYFQEYFGEYPYPNITFLNPPLGAQESGGMEYPTFFTAGRFSEVPKNILFRHQLVTIHEFGHQIFYGVIGSNEFESSWMDEGLNSFGTQRTIDTYYKGVINRSDFLLTNENMDRFSYLARPNNESLLTTSYKQKNSNYGTNTYPRPAILLRALEKHIGVESFKKGMKYYYQKWKFKHPKPNDFFNAMSEGSGIDLAWFFDQFFRENKVVDYELSRISHSKLNFDNFVKQGHQVFPNTDFSGEKPIYLNRIEIKNHGNGYFPIELKLATDEGKSWDKAVWNFKNTYNYLEIYSNSPISKAQLDPDRKVVIDLSYSNNGKQLKVQQASGKFVHRWQFWVQNITQFLGGF